MLTSLRLGIGAVAALAVWSAAPAGGDKGKDHAGDKGHVMVRPGETIRVLDAASNSIMLTLTVS